MIAHHSKAYCLKNSWSSLGITLYYLTTLALAFPLLLDSTSEDN